jgi:hypothetical protein
MATAKEAGEYVLRRLLDGPFSTRATRAHRFASVSVPAATLKLLRVGFLISVTDHSKAFFIKWGLSSTKTIHQTSSLFDKRRVSLVEVYRSLPYV